MRINREMRQSSADSSVYGSTEGLIPTRNPYPSRQISTSSETINEIKHRNTVPKNIKTLSSTDFAERVKHMSSKSPMKEPLVQDDETDDEEEDEEWEEISKVSVPLTISMGIIGLYIIGGAILFKYWEGWDMLQASYFCFITLSVIGFGDVTPGRDFTDPTANARLVIGTIYSIFGMAILSMCFSLMQEEMISKFRWIGRKMGVISDEDDDDDYSSIDLDKSHNDKDQQGQTSPSRPHYRDSSDC